MKKFHANCKLKLEISEEGEVLAFKFTQPPFGGYLATIRTNKIEPCHLSQSSKDIPGWFSRLIFSLSSGIKDYELTCKIVSDEKPRHYANFYRCRDRHNRERFFAEINEVDSDVGGSFLIAKEDYDAVSSQIRQALSLNLEEQNA